jgi:hypothetical protein
VLAEVEQFLELVQCGAHVGKRRLRVERGQLLDGEGGAER